MNLRVPLRSALRTRSDSATRPRPFVRSAGHVLEDELGIESLLILRIDRP